MVDGCDGWFILVVVVMAWACTNLYSQALCVVCYNDERKKCIEIGLQHNSDWAE